ncbi:Cell wall-associated hydrolase, NlpC family [Pisciglobus halotolerans]|uniref:Cell wall-associated hydrolase, NlpC family n=2 Tax=Pisciglobus halotolerans TaxID=745365 RepID=A0A1I3CVU3_9LACT|nr:Cell wall-associated hydrolase, NlpC family [Pisciglobus halotolerans]
MKMKKKLFTVAVLGTMMTSSLVLPTSVSAASYDTKIEEAKNQAEKSQQLIDQKNQELNSLKEKSSTTKNELQSLSSSIAANEAKTAKLVKEMETTKKERETLLKEIAELEKNIESRNEQLKEQARVVQVDGETQNYLDFIIEAESLGDIIGRINVVSELVGANKTLVQKQVDDKKAVEGKKEKTEQTIVQQDTLAGELEMLRSEMEKQALDKEVLVAQLALETSTAEGDIAKFSEMKNSAEQQVAQYTSAQKEAEEQAQLIAAQQAEQEEQEAQQAKEAQETQETQVALAAEESQEQPAESTQETTTVATNESQSSATSANKTTNTQAQSSSSSNTSAKKNETSHSSSNHSNATASSSSQSNSNSSKTNSSSSSNQTSEKKDKPKQEAPKQTVSSGSVLSVAAEIVSKNPSNQIPYVWGGTTMSGFDCSGFTQYVFAKAGKSLPRDSRAQYSASTKISSPQPGDLVFFGKSSSPSSIFHVAIYTGGGNMVGSQSSTGPAYKNSFKTNAYWGKFHVFYGRF